MYNILIHVFYYNTIFQHLLPLKNKKTKRTFTATKIKLQYPKPVHFDFILYTAIYDNVKLWKRTVKQGRKLVN